VQLPGRVGDGGVTQQHLRIDRRAHPYRIP
jgi:hypothetical protein